MDQRPSTDACADALDAARRRAIETYDAAADRYDDPANGFWARHGRRTVERMGLRPGDRVLDMCCGSGASALPAAVVVGPAGHVTGIDLAARMLDLARGKAATADLGNIRFTQGDMFDTGLPSEAFDAVICVFGIFFVPDVAGAARQLWRLVRPGGQLAITTWGPRFLEPGSSIFWEAVKAERPDLFRAFNPWERLSTPEALSGVLTAAGIGDAQVMAQDDRETLRSLDDWWPMVLGTGYRGTIDKLDADARDRVRAACIDALARGAVAAVETNVVYAIARKPAAGR